MLDKETCLIIKSCLGIVQGMQYQIDSLFAMIDAMNTGVVNDDTKVAFEKAARLLKDNTVNISKTLDRIMETGNHAEKLSADIPKIIN